MKFRFLFFFLENIHKETCFSLGGFFFDMLVEDARSVAVMSYVSLVVYVLLLFVFLRYSVPCEDDNTIRLLLATSSLLCFAYLCKTSVSSYRLWKALKET